MNPEWVHACNPVRNQPWAYLMLYVDAAWLPGPLAAGFFVRERNGS
ncbi:AraC family ligand binding domain-containing protein [Marinobacter aromaticivorans]|uniref:AraC family ligand binding domain-containing protein n=1 Tax=Marinobacter aromaticivorans TaxID=1494078 RepID=A0ABW2IRL0_9GAMM